MAHGSCLCGEVKYSFTGQPAMQAICHCLSCRKLTGTLYTTNLVIPSSTFTLLSGATSLKSYTTKHESGLNFKFQFCQNCATKIYKEGDGDDFKDMLIVMAGSLDKSVGEETMGIEDVMIGAELFVKHRVKWLEPMEGKSQCMEFV